MAAIPFRRVPLAASAAGLVLVRLGALLAHVPERGQSPARILAGQIGQLVSG